jgi:hypothetical protein
MITAQEFRQSWQRVEGDRLVAFPADTISDVELPADARAFLIEAGLPCEAAPFLSFGRPERGTLERVSAVYDQACAFDRYRIIGSNGSGDPVCLDEEAGGQIVYLNHDNRLQRVLMASSVFTLAECLLAFRDIIVDAGDTQAITAQRFEELLQRFRTIDPAPSTVDGYWQQELRNFSAST